MPRVVIGLIGEMGAGKETVTKKLRNLLDLYEKDSAVVHTGNFLRDQLRNWNIPETRENLQKLAICMQENFGNTTIIDALEWRIKSSPAQVVIYDSVRWLADVDMISRFPHLFLYVTASPETRWQRMKDRKEKLGEEFMTFREFQTRETMNTETSIPMFGRAADFIISNDGCLSDLDNQVDRFFHEYIRVHNVK